MLEFKYIAREWRMKYKEGGLKGGAVLVDHIFKTKYLPILQQVPGLTALQRLACGGCNDFRICIVLKRDRFAEFEAGGFGPENAFLGEVMQVPGISSVEKQTLSLDLL
jgi:hypothetical protein